MALSNSLTNNGIREPKAAAEGDGHQSHRLALLIGMLVAFSTMFDPAAAAQDAEEQRGLRSNTPEATPGYVIFNANGSLTTYLIDLEGRVVHMWQSDYAPGGGAYLLDNGHLLRGHYQEGKNKKEPEHARKPKQVHQWQVVVHYLPYRSVRAKRG